MKLDIKKLNNSCIPLQQCINISSLFDELKSNNLICQNKQGIITFPCVLNKKYKMRVCCKCADPLVIQKIIDSFYDDKKSMSDIALQQYPYASKYKLLEKLQIMCTNNKNRCNWTGNYFDAQKHLKHCNLLESEQQIKGKYIKNVDSVNTSKVNSVNSQIDKDSHDKITSVEPVNQIQNLQFLQQFKQQYQLQPESQLKQKQKETFLQQQQQKKQKQEQTILIKPSSQSTCSVQQQLNLQQQAQKNQQIQIPIQIPPSLPLPLSECHSQQSVLEFRLNKVLQNQKSKIQNDKCICKLSPPDVDLLSIQAHMLSNGYLHVRRGQEILFDIQEIKNETALLLPRQQKEEQELKVYLNSMNVLKDTLKQKILETEAASQLQEKDIKQQFDEMSKIKNANSKLGMIFEEVKNRRQNQLNALRKEGIQMFQQMLEKHRNDKVSVIERLKQLSSSDNDNIEMKEESEIESLVEITESEKILQIQNSDSQFDDDSQNSSASRSINSVREQIQKVKFKRIRKINKNKQQGCIQYSYIQQVQKQLPKKTEKGEEINKLETTQNNNNEVDNLQKQKVKTKTIPKQHIEYQISFDQLYATIAKKIQTVLMQGLDLTMRRAKEIVNERIANGAKMILQLDRKTTIKNLMKRVIQEFNLNTIDD